MYLCMTKQKPIPCTVGMLAWNSARTLECTLQNVSDFVEVIIADGGSTDDTLAIATKYGARVIPQTNPGHPITDFSKERNLLLDATTQPWFLWLDSDETITDELREEIRAVCAEPTPKYLAYNIRIDRCNPTTFEPFVELRPNYQMRFFSTSIGGRYVNKVHEHITFDRAKYPVGTLKGAWRVPLMRMDFASYKREVDKRFPVLVREKPPRTFGGFVRKGIARPLVASIKILMRAILLRMMHPFGHVVPWVVERGRLYTQWVIARESWRVYRLYTGN